MSTAYEEELLHTPHPGQAETLKFESRRSAVLGRRGMVACSQPLAAEVQLLVCFLWLYSALSQAGAPQT